MVDPRGRGRGLADPRDRMRGLAAHRAQERAALFPRSLVSKREGVG